MCPFLGEVDAFLFAKSKYCLPAYLASILTLYLTFLSYFPVFGCNLIYSFYSTFFY